MLQTGDMVMRNEVCIQKKRIGVILLELIMVCSIIWIVYCLKMNKEESNGLKGVALLFYYRQYGMFFPVFIGLLTCTLIGIDYESGAIQQRLIVNKLQNILYAKYCIIFIHVIGVSVLLLLGRYFVYGEFLINELLIVGVLIIWSVSESIIAGLVILITKREIMGLAVCIVLYMLECSRHIQYSALRYFLNFVSRVLFDFHSYN